MANSLGPHRHPVVARVSDEHALLVGEQSGWDSWLLATYLEPGVAYRSHEFIRRFRADLPDDLRSLHSAHLLRAVVYDSVLTEDLIHAYKTFGLDLNAASLCLYSGPALPAVAVIFDPDTRPELAKFWNDRNRRVAWLGTGDAVLKGTKRVEAMTQHFAAHIEKVGTLTLPHHGSDHNVDELLIERVGAGSHVVSARSGSAHHPGPRVTKLFAGRKTPMMTVVTSDEASIHVETVS